MRNVLMFCTLICFAVGLVILSGSGIASNNAAEIFSQQHAQKMEREGWESMPTILARILPPNFPKVDFNVRDYGAVADSKTNDRSAFVKAIDVCAKAGGGNVIIPSGVYFVKGPLHLKSNVHLMLEEGARILFSQDPEDYLPAVKVRWEGTICYNYSPLIYGYQLKNIAITGKGIIDGAAQRWSKEWRKQQDPDKDRLRKMGNDTIPENQRVFADGYLDLDGDGKDDGFGDGLRHYLRPTLIEFYECENILIQDLTIMDSPFWTVHPVFSKNITLRNLTISGSVTNDDGVDPDGCADVLIEGCKIQTHDDAIAIKAGRDQDAWSRPGSKDIIVRNNKLLSGANALCIGSEMSGGVRYIFAENNFIANANNALSFKCNLDRGGQVEKVFIRNTEIDTCRGAMFMFTMNYQGYRGNNFPTKFNDFYVSGITCRKVERKPFTIVGVPGQHIKRLYLNEITIDQAGEESQIEYVDDLIFWKVKIGGEPFEHQ